MVDLKPFLEMYERFGIAVLPAVYGQKRPAVEWKKFQEKAPTKAQVKEWFKDGEHNIAALCGVPSSNLVVLDFDDTNIYPSFFDRNKIEGETLVVETGSGKIHVYLRSEKPVQSFRIPQLKLEVRSTGNVVIAPPSKHPTGGFYKFLNPEVENLIVVTDLVDAIWKKAEQLGVKVPVDLFLEETEERREGEAYEGPDPPCIQSLLKGVEEGLRNEAGVRLGSYWLRFKRVGKADDLLHGLKRWNKLNKPPLTEAELKNVAESASKLDRSYGCRLNQAWCQPDNCILMRNRLLRQEAENEAQAILSTSNVLDVLAPHLNNIIAGEDDNKKLEFILMLSGKTDDPTLKQIILLKSEPGAGKTHLMRLADAFKTKSVGRFSAHALDYTDLRGYQILRLKELGGMDQEFQGVSTVKFLSADDQGYTIEVTERDERGRFTTSQYRVPPITVVTSTTRVELDPQFVRRAWIENPDESKEQTERIAKWKANLELQKADVALGLLKETDYDHSLRVLRAIVKKLEVKNVVLPFPEALTKLLGYEKLRVRGDYDKFFSLIKLHALLHQHTLPIIKGANGHEVILALPKQAFEALKIAEKPYVTMTTDLEQRSRNLISILEAEGIEKAGEVIDKELRGKISIKLNRSERTVLSYLRDWANAGYMAATETTARGKPVEFKLLYDLGDIKAKSGVSLEISRIAEVMGSDFEKEAESFLNRLGKKISYGEGFSEEALRERLKVSMPLPSEKNFLRQSDEDLGLDNKKGQLTSADSQIAEEKRSTSMQEVLERAHAELTKFTQTQFVDYLVKLGKSEQEAGSLFKHWTDPDVEQLIVMDPDGWWTWAK